MPLLGPTTLADITVPYCRAYGLDREGTSGLKGSATWGFKVDYVNRWAFLQQINGVFAGTDSQGNPTTTYRLPMQFPPVPGLLVSGSDVEMRGRSLPWDPANPYRYAFIRVDFAAPTYPVDTQLTVDFQAGAEIAVLPNTKVTVGGVPLPGDLGVGVPIAVQGLTVTRHRVPTVTMANVAPYAKCINSDSFQGCDPGTVMFDGVNARTDYPFGGSGLSEVSYQFSWRSVAWDQALVGPQTVVTPDYTTIRRVAFGGIFS